MKQKLAILLATAMMFLQLTACTEAPTPSTETEKHTEAATIVDTQGLTEAETSAPQLPTEAPSEAPTEAPVETPTEVETEADTEPEIKPEDYTEVDYDAYLTLEPETPPEGEGMTIGGVDISEFSIVRPAELPNGLITTLELFTTQLQKVTGVTLPVITDDQSAEHEIVIGATCRENSALNKALTEIVDDGYAIVVDGGDLYISATTGRGVVYGVCDFMEKYLGVRLYATDFIYCRPVGEITLEEGLKDVFSPEFFARRLWIEKLVEDPLDNLIFNKNNCDGLKKAKVGDTLVIRANSNHTIDNLAGAASEAVVPCLTDEEVYKTVLAAVVAKIEKNPNQSAIQVGQGDGGRPCECSRCTAVHNEYGTNNATWFLFVNRLADEIATLYPESGIKIISYAYQFTHGVPGNGFALSDNVIINFCFDKACYQHAFNDPRCEKNVPVVAELREWAKQCKADNLYVYEYAYNCGDATLPDPNLFVMWDNFRLYLECGVNGILAEGIPCKGGDFDHLRAYMRSKLTWNPHMTREEYFAIFRQFMVDYYGDAAPMLIEYMKILWDGERSYCTDMFTPMYTFYRTGEEAKETDVSQELLLRCQALFDEALALETLTEEQRNHLEYASIHLFLVRWHHFPKDDPDGKSAYYKTIYQFRNKYGV